MHHTKKYNKTDKFKVLIDDDNINQIQTLVNNEKFLIVKYQLLVYAIMNKKYKIVKLFVKYIKFDMSGIFDEVLKIALYTKNMKIVEYLINNDQIKPNLYTNLGIIYFNLCKYLNCYDNTNSSDRIAYNIMQYEQSIDKILDCTLSEKNIRKINIRYNDFDIMFSLLKDSENIDLVNSILNHPKFNILNRSNKLYQLINNKILMKSIIIK